MLELAKLALRIVTDAFDDEINLLINDCYFEMESLGIRIGDVGKEDPQIQSAVIAYCKWKFGDAENKDAFERIYHEKLGQLMMMYKAGYVSAEREKCCG